MRVTWIGGWGVAPEALRPVAERFFSGSAHAFVTPTAKNFETISQHLTRPSGTLSPSDGERDGVRGVPDLLVAWSLGANRVIEAASRGVEFPGMVLLLAPFVAFPSESKLGGKCSITQVKFLRRWVEREPLAALGDFYQRVRMMDAPTELPYALPDLIEGLDRLSEDASPALREFAARGLPRNWQALIGDNDPLLDGAAVCRSLPGCVLMRGAGHAIADLLAASQAP